MEKKKEKHLSLADKTTGNKINFLVKDFILPNGLHERFYIQDDNDSVQVLAITSDLDVVLVEQFRPGNEQKWLETPGGGLEEGETELEKAAARELLEETGYAGEIHYLATIPYNPYSSGVRHCFVAWDCYVESKDLDLDPNEFLKPRLVPMDKFLELAAQAKVRGADMLYPAARLLEETYGIDILQK